MSLNPLGAGWPMLVAFIAVGAIGVLALWHNQGVLRAWPLARPGLLGGGILSLLLAILAILTNPTNPLAWILALALAGAGLTVLMLFRRTSFPSVDAKPGRIDLSGLPTVNLGGRLTEEHDRILGEARSKDLGLPPKK